MTPLILIVGGLILSLFFYGPIIFYIIWSWRWLRKRTDDAQANRIPILPLPGMAIASAVLWSLVVGFAIPLSVLLFYNYIPQYKSLIDVVNTIVLLPVIVVFSILSLILGVQQSDGYIVDGHLTLVFFASATLVLALLLLMISYIEWWFLRRFHRRLAGGHE